MGFFAEAVKPRIFDLVMRVMDDMRGEALAAAEGEVLEIGFGTGRNLEHYPSGVARVAGLDPMPSRWRRVTRRMESAPFPVEHHRLRADGRLPFEDERFDTVVTTWTLCSIERPVDALREMRRVLRPGGRYLFIEHGRSDEPGVARWQDRLNPVQKLLADGCNMNRKIDALVAEGGFRVDHLDRFRADGPRVLAEMYRGTARRE